MDVLNTKSQLESARNVHDLSSLNRLREAAYSKDDKALKEAAQQFEAIFVQMMLKSMRKAQDAMADKDSPFNTEEVKFYRDMHDKQLAQDLSSGGGVGLGGFFRYRLPGVPEVSVAGYGYYAPPVISFSDADNIFDADLRLQYSLIPTARVYVGYRYTGIKIEDVSDRFELGDGAHVGLRLDF